MGAVELLSAVVGLLMPPLVAAVTGGRLADLPAWAKLAIAIGTSAVLGTITAWATGALGSAQEWSSAVGAVFIASQVAYRAWWHREPTRPATPAG